MLFHREVGVALEEEDVLPDVVCPREARREVAELVADHPVDVVLAPGESLLDRFVGRLSKRLLDRHDRLQQLVFDLDRLARRGSRLLVDGGDRGHRVAHVADLVLLERGLVLADREDTEPDRQVAPGQDRHHARHPARRRGVEGEDPGVRRLGPEDLAMQHPGQCDVVGVDGLAPGLCRPVELGKRPAYGPELAHRAAIRPAASSTASRILA